MSRILGPTTAIKDTPRRVHVRLCQYHDLGFINGRVADGERFWAAVKREARRIRMARKRRRGWA